MLEKLFYKGSLKVRWDFDITMGAEAEAYLNQMAEQGYELKWVACDEGYALFVKSQPGEEKAYSVTIMHAERLPEEEAYKQFAAEAGWTYLCTTADELSVFVSPRQAALPPLDTDQMVSLEVVEAVSRDKGRVGGNVIAGLLFIALSCIRFTNTGEPLFSDLLLQCLFIGIGLEYLCKAYLNWLSVRRLRARIIAGAEVKLFCTSKIDRRVRRILFLFYGAALPLISWVDDWADPGRVLLYTVYLVIGYLLVIEIALLVKPSWQQAVVIIYLTLIIFGAFFLL